MKIISRTVILLSIISLFNDISSEMLYPVMPVFLKSIGFSVFLIGILEGLAEATAGLSKGYFGKLSDDLGKRVPFIRFGYTLSAISKPMMALISLPLWIFSARTIDKLGKGVRTGARDAMLSDEATPETKGKVFGFHRAMDTMGAVLGPLCALIYLHFYPSDYKTMFLIVFIPGAVTILFTFFLKDKEQVVIPPHTAKTSFLSFFRYWKNAPIAYRKLMYGLLAFALFNSSDLFLLLKIKEVTGDDSAVIKTYIFYNLIYALASYPLGALGDKLSLRTVFIFGLGVFTIVYAGMAFATSVYVCYGLFFLYGIFSAATEGISKAWVTNVCDKKDTATAIGTYTAFQSIAIMFASFIAGFLWYQFDPSVTFLATAGVTSLVIFYFAFQKRTLK